MKRPALALLVAAAVAGCGGGETASPDEPAELRALLADSREEASSALARVVERRDRRYVGPLIELLRAGELGIGGGVTLQEVIDALQALSGQRLAGDWNAWVEWYAGTRLRPPPGFTVWKGRIMSQIDLRFGRFFAEGEPSRIRVEEVVWGGVQLDGIPALDEPRTLPAADAGYLDPEDPVFGVELNGDARAYPLRILDWHEMANDVVGGVPVSLAYCTLCGAGVLYETRTSERTFDFGSSGFLMRSNKLMYDRQTYTLWNQLTGEPVLGPLADEDIELEVRPLVVTSWRRWRRQHPDTRVLSMRTGFDRPYERGAAYGRYFASPEKMFPARSPRRGLAPKERVFALRLGSGAAKAYPIARILPRGVVNDRVGGQPVAVVTAGGRLITRGREARTGLATVYDSGAEVRAFERGKRRFRPAGQGALRDERDRVWRVTERALLGPGGERLERLGGHLAYAFGWLSYFPNSEIYRG